nr:MAG TPA: FocB protein-alpha, helix-turn-helix, TRANSCRIPTION.4A [Caudoviricetes sp.]
MSARVKLPPELADLLRSELDDAIKESALHRDDELIARRYLIDKWCQMDIAAELGWRRATVGDHLKHILERVENVSAKLYTNRT